MRKRTKLVAALAVCSTVYFAGHYFVIRDGANIDSDPAPYHIKQVLTSTPSKIVDYNVEGKKYAVLVVGEDFWSQPLNNVTAAYDLLLGKGYSPEDVFVFVPSKEKLGKRENIADFVNSEFEIYKTLYSLTQKIKEQDEFFFFYTGHCSGQNLIIGSGINVESLEMFISSMPAKKKVLLFDCCYSETFSERLGVGDAIAISTSKKDKLSFFQSRFSQLLFSALNDEEADANRDGKVSLKEAFVYAAENDPMQTRMCLLSILGARQVPNLQYENLNPEDFHF